MNVAAPGLRMPGIRLPSAWRRLGRREIGYTAVIGFAVFAWFILIDISSEVFHEPFGPETVWHLVNQLWHYEFLSFSLLLALVLADDAVDRGAPRLPTYALAIVAGSLAGVLVLRLLMLLQFWGQFARRGYPVGQLILGFLGSCSRCLPLAIGLGFLYAEIRHTRRTQAQLHAAELARAQRTRVAFEAQLSALQARVEPQFLLDTLGRVGNLYDGDVTRADAMLDDLIAYLRAAMPKMRESSSTVAQEAELARRYLAIVASRTGAGMAWEIAMPDEVADARMPPMVLLPLIDCALSGGLAADSRARLRVEVAREKTTLRVDVAVQGDAFARGTADERIRMLRDRLAVLHGTRSQLTLGWRDTHWSAASVEMPYEAGGTAEPAAS